MVMRGLLARTARVLAVGGPAAASVVTVSATGAWAAPPSETPLSGPHVFGWGFDFPGAVSSDGTDVWIADNIDNSVIELNASTGTLVRWLRAGKFQFSQPQGVSSAVWAANSLNNTVTGFPAG
jgi:hypothetical protein